MDIFSPARNSGSRPDEWNRKLPRGCPRKLNFYTSSQSQKLPDVHVSNGQINTLTWASKSNYHGDASKLTDSWFAGEYRDKKKTVARKHLIGSLSAPMKNTSAVKTSSIGLLGGSPPRWQPEVNRTSEGDNSRHKPEGDHLQGIDKIDNIFQRRLSLKVQKLPAHPSLPNHMQPTSLENRAGDSGNVRRPLFMTSDVGKLSDLKDMLKDDVSDDNQSKELTDSSDNSRPRRLPRQISQHRPLTPNLVKKLNNMKLSTFTKTQIWVNQLPQDPPVFNRHLTTHASCSQTSFGKHLNYDIGQVHKKWIYGGDR